VPLTISFDALENLVPRESLLPCGRSGEWRGRRAIVGSDVPGVQYFQGIVDLLWIEQAFATPILQNLIFLVEGKRGKQKVAHLFRTHEVWEADAALWNDELDNFA
jgi:hypothetical protein